MTARLPVFQIVLDRSQRTAEAFGKLHLSEVSGGILHPDLIDLMWRESEAFFVSLHPIMPRAVDLVLRI